MSQRESILEPALWLLRWRGYSLLLQRRALAADAGLALALLLAIGLALLAGSSWLAPTDLLAVLSGKASAAQRLLLLEFRLPRVMLGALAGAALGLAGCLLQLLSRNRLATPDMLGLADGATLAMLLALLAGSSGMLGPWWVGPLGALLALGLLLLLAGRHGRHGARLLIVGLALASLLRAVLELALSRQELLHASALYAWSLGSLNGRGYGEALPLALALLALLPLLAISQRRLALLQFQPALARSLGLAVGRSVWQTLLCAVLLAGLAIGLCGPIAFVAMAAPLLADRLGGGGRVPLLGSALAGAVLVVLADTLARCLLSDAELPVGVICKLLGGPCLLWLLLGNKERTTR